MTTVRDAALAALDAGISVIPILADGSKRPPFSWSAFQTELPTEQQAASWFDRGQYTGYAMICGVVSGNLETLDFDNETTYRDFLETVEGVGLGPLVDRIRAGYEERTPSGGAHLPYYCDTIGGNSKLAKDESGSASIETRGIGGYVIAAPSNGTVHPTGGAWELICGDVTTIATITPEERIALHALARSFDRTSPREAENDASQSPRSDATGTRPGDDYRDKHRSLAAFQAIVEPHGWKLTHRRGNTGYFRRPGKDEGWSATYNHADSGLFYVFSSSTSFEPERGYNPFSVYAMLNHGGDFKSAATELGRQGYGTPTITATADLTFTRKPKTKQEAAFSPAPMPDDAITGWFREYVDIVEPTAESSVAFHVATSISFVGACIGKRVGFHHASDRLYPNFYTLLIGPTGSARKDTAIRRMIDMFYVAPPAGEPLLFTGMPFALAKDISSSEGLIAMLRRKSNVLLYAAEFSKIMSNAARESTKSIGPTLIEAFDTPPSMQNNTKANVESAEPMEARNPFVSVVTSVQPEKLSEIVNGDLQYSGFLNRWWLIQGKGVGPRPDPPYLDETRAWHLMRRMLKAVSDYQEGTLLKMNPAAVALWSDWYIASYPTGHESSQEDAMGVRRGTIVKKIALVHAVLDGARAIEVEHIRIGIALSDWAWEHTRRLLPTWGESKDAELERKILERLNQFGPMKKREVQRKVGSRLGPGVFARIVKAMVENGDLTVTEDGMMAIRDED